MAPQAWASAHEAKAQAQAHAFSKRAHSSSKAHKMSELLSLSSSSRVARFNSESNGDLMQWLLH